MNLRCCITLSKFLNSKELDDAYFPPRHANSILTLYNEEITDSDVIIDESAEVQ